MSNKKNKFLEQYALHGFLPNIENKKHPQNINQAITKISDQAIEVYSNSAKSNAWTQHWTNVWVNYCARNTNEELPSEKTQDDLELQTESIKLKQ